MKSQEELLAMMKVKPNGATANTVLPEVVETEVVETKVEDLQEEPVKEASKDTFDLILIELRRHTTLLTEIRNIHLGVAVG